MSGKIGIFLPGLYGDIMQAMSVLPYKDTLWPGKDIIWFCSNEKMKDLFKFNDKISEIRHWPEGWGLPERCEIENLTAASKGEQPWADFSQLKTPENRLDQEKKHQFELTSDLDEGYFPTPWMMSLSQRHGIAYANISKKVFGADPNWEWHPYLCFSDEEKESVQEFCSKLPYSKTIMLETNFNSGKSPWDDNLTQEVMAICRQRLGKCNFIFACAGDNTRFVDDDGIVTCNDFTVRQSALMNNYSDLFIGISSGISQAVNCWGNKPIPKLQYCGSYIMSSVPIANGPFHLIVTDPPGSNLSEHERLYPPNIHHREVFKTKLAEVLGQI